MRLLNFLKTKSEKSEKTSQEVNEYVENKKSGFQSDMKKLKRQSQVTHRKALQTHHEAVKLNNMIEGITLSIARAQGRFK